MRLSVQELVRVRVPADCLAGGVERVEEQMAIVIRERRSFVSVRQEALASAIRSVKCGASISMLRIAACRRCRASAYSAGEPGSVTGR